MNNRHINTFRQYIDNKINEIVTTESEITEDNNIKNHTYNPDRIKDLERRFDEIINGIEEL